MNATPFCPSCGAYTASLPDDHTPEWCAEDKRRETYARGAETARAELAAARAAIRPATEEETP